MCISVTARTPTGTMNDTPLTAPGAGVGGKEKASPALVLALNTTHVPAAPRLAADGRVTAIVKYIATAASTALPPAIRMSRPTSAALLSSAETAAKVTPPRKRGLRPDLRAIVPTGLLTLAGSGSLPPQPDTMTA